MSSQAFWDPKMSAPMNPTATSMTMWIRARWLIIRAVGLGLCSRRNVWTWTRRRIVLAEIPIPTSQKNAFLIAVELEGLSLSISMGTSIHSECLKRKAGKILFTTNITFTIFNQHYYHDQNMWIDPNASISMHPWTWYSSLPSRLPGCHYASLPQPTPVQPSHDG